jgi:hypothetical protein
LLLCLSHLPLGVPNYLAIIIIINYTPAIKPFSWRRCRGRKRRPLQGEFFACHILYFVLLFCFTLFIFTCIVFYQKHKKLVYFIVAFIYLLLVHHVVP